MAASEVLDGEDPAASALVPGGDGLVVGVDEPGICLATGAPARLVIECNAKPRERLRISYPAVPPESSAFGASGLRLWYPDPQAADGRRYLAPGKHRYEEIGGRDGRLELWVDAVGASSAVGDRVITIDFPKRRRLPARRIPVTALRIDLDADTDRSGGIDLADEVGEDGWTRGPEGRGAIILPNCDRDRLEPGPPDNWAGGDWDGDGSVSPYEAPDDRIDGLTDLQDIGRLVLRRFGPDRLPSGVTASLRVIAVAPDLPFDRDWFEEAFLAEEDSYCEDQGWEDYDCDAFREWGDDDGWGEDEEREDRPDLAEGDEPEADRSDAVDDAEAALALVRRSSSSGGAEEDDDDPEVDDQDEVDAERLADLRSQPRWLIERPGPYCVRVFWPNGVQGDRRFLRGDETSIIGPEHEGDRHELPLADLAGAGEIELGVEGIGFGTLVDLVLTVRHGERVVGSDRVRLRVAPFVLADHRQEVGDDDLAVAWVHVNEDGENNRMLREALRQLYGAGRVDEPPLDDLWHQDGYEVGYVKAPYGGMPVVLELARGATWTDGESLIDYVREQVLSPGVGICADLTRVDHDSTFDAGGNIECMPLGPGPGSFVFEASMSRMLPAFFAVQGVNEVRPVDTDWLSVGHIDEAVAFTGLGTAALADPETAYALLLWARGVDPDVVLPVSEGTACEWGFGTCDSCEDEWGDDCDWEHDDEDWTGPAAEDGESEDGDDEPVEDEDDGDGADPLADGEAVMTDEDAAVAEGSMRGDASAGSMDDDASVIVETEADGVDPVAEADGVEGEPSAEDAEPVADEVVLEDTEPVADEELREDAEPVADEALRKTADLAAEETEPVDPEPGVDEEASEPEDPEAEIEMADSGSEDARDEEEDETDADEADDGDVDDDAIDEGQYFLTLDEVLDPDDILRSYNLEIVMAEDQLGGVVGELGLKRYADRPQAATANAGDLRLDRIGALVAWLPGTAIRREYQVTFIDADRYRIAFRDHGEQPGPWQEGGQGQRNEDLMDRSSLLFIFREWWSDGVAQAGDVFTCLVRCRPRAVPVPVIFHPIDDQARALTANAVNCIVDGQLAIAALPTGPVLDYRGTGRASDILADYVRSAFKAMGMRHVALVDDSAYHDRDGSLHCATNVIRRVPELDWWRFETPEPDLPFDQ